MSHARHRAAELPELAERLRRKSHKLTGPRQAILALLHHEAHPLSSKEIFERLSKGDSNLVTIYRSLHLLEKMGMVKRFDFGDGVARYELISPDHDDHHHHLICTRCSSVVEIEACFPGEWEQQIAKDHGFKGVTHRLEFFGICPRCSKPSQV